MEDCLKVQGLTKQYRKCRALDHLSLHIPQGAIYGLVGKNGSGKTTLIRLICGLQQPTAGEYSLYGVSCKDPAIAKCRRRMGAVVETPSIYRNMTARENLEQQYRILGIPTNQGIDELLKLVGLADTGKKKASHFSLGMRQRLGIAIALAGDPDFLVLDEPANGLDPQGIIEIRELILNLNRRRQVTVLISSHILDELSRLATHFGFLDQGHLLKEISARELEAACQKSIRIQVSDLRTLVLTAHRMGLDCQALDETTAQISAEVNITQLVQALAKEGCQVLRLTNQEESLESYYMNLVGGDAE
ncbi:MAG TPA: ATP-binding cassette domain-containing protein [Candidatus Egerieicola pullicola]|uniref:ATP-binding cassette domain-containing protein n=1 Tax=Candidatus Egerieicola pullicola TaxID=2840775 RepID=A0A9D1ALX2_9FIRM|nr:ATP-binding cassette domain-containing protein [Candidatus Egerieicola pullicola]